jgi:hypothetical protein
LVKKSDARSLNDAKCAVGRSTRLTSGPNLMKMRFVAFASIWEGDAGKRPFGGEQRGNRLPQLENIIKN